MHAAYKALPNALDLHSILHRRLHQEKYGLQGIYTPQELQNFHWSIAIYESTISGKEAGKSTVWNPDLFQR
jgi:hypothetical protein